MAEDYSAYTPCVSIGGAIKSLKDCFINILQYNIMWAEKIMHIKILRPITLTIVMAFLMLYIIIWYIFDLKN